MPDEPYRPATKLVHRLTILLIVYAGLGLLAAWYGWHQMKAMDEIMAEIEAAQAEQDGEPTQSWVDAHILPGHAIPVALGQLGVGIALIALFCLWIPRANRNARALGAKGMRFTPEWCVLWYLIPILNLFQPYRAMREIWLASDPADGTRWREQRVSLLLPLWWALWLACLFANFAAYRGTPDPHGAPPWEASEFSILADALDAPLSIVALLLVRRIHARQEHSRATTAFD